MNPASPWPSDGWFEKLLPWLREMNVDGQCANADFAAGPRRLTLAGPTDDTSVLGFAVSIEGTEFQCAGGFLDIGLAAKGFAKWLSGEDFRIGGIETA